MELRHKGFDGLELTVATNIRYSVADQFLEAQEQAKKQKSPSLLKLSGLIFLVNESGVTGGYKFCADTGPLGATWMFKYPNARDPWGIKISCKSTPMALYGLDHCLEEVYETLQKLGCVFTDEMIRVSRVDYAQDYYLDDFELSVENLVTHNRVSHESNIITENGVSSKTTSLRVGKISGMQVGIYDKRLDVISKRKHEWWEIWNYGGDNQGYLKLTPENSAGKIWRIEVRAGKNFLRRSAGIVTVKDLQTRCGDALCKVANNIRYTTPSADTNRSRWKNSDLWDSVLENLAGGLKTMISNMPPDLVKRIVRETLIHDLTKQTFGCNATLAVALRLTNLDTEEIVEKILEYHRGMMLEDTERLHSSMGKASERYQFIA